MKSLMIQTCQNNLGSSLYTMLSVYYIVVTSDNLMKSKKKLSTDSSVLLLNTVLWDTLDTNNFYFIFFYFSDFILILFFFSFFFFFFLFGQWRGMWHYSYMTCHMMWHHRPRTWWKNLEDNIRAHIYNMVTLSGKWGGHEVVAWTIGQA